MAELYINPATDWCATLSCECGTDLHIDGDYFREVKCSTCGRTYRLAGITIEVPPEDG